MVVVSAWATTICPPKSEWTLEDIPDLTGQVIIVTGAYQFSIILHPSVAKHLGWRRRKCRLRKGDRQGIRLFRFFKDDQQLTRRWATGPPRAQC